VAVFISVSAYKEAEIPQKHNAEKMICGVEQETGPKNSAGLILRTRRVT
jgi:hypothetical protein